MARRTRAEGDYRYMGVHLGQQRGPACGFFHSKLFRKGLAQWLGAADPNIAQGMTIMRTDHSGILKPRPVGLRQSQINLFNLNGGLAPGRMPDPEQPPRRAPLRERGVSLQQPFVKRASCAYGGSVACVAL